MRISTSKTTFSFPFFFFLFFFYWSMNIANRITSQMAFNIFSTSINICSLAISLRLVLRMGTEKSSSTPCECTRAPTRMFCSYTAARLNIHTYECMEANRREIFWTVSLLGLRARARARAEERIKCCRTSANIDAVFARPKERSVSVVPPISVHTHRSHMWDRICDLMWTKDDTGNGDWMSFCQVILVNKMSRLLPFRDSK